MSETQTKKPEAAEELLDVLPTVFVGLGGTGMEVMLRVRRRIIQADWSGERIANIDEFPPAQFFYFDTDTADAQESGRAKTSDPLGARVAFAKGETLQKKVDIAHYQSDIKRHRHIRDWWPEGDLSSIDTEKGAGQIRSISRLLFFDEFSNFREIVKQKSSQVMQNVTNEDGLRRLGLKTSTKLRVVVIASVAGGTGSGSFIDVGYALRSMRTPKIDQLDLFLMLPGGFEAANKDRVFANGYAALSELEFAMRGTQNPAYVDRWTDLDAPAPGVTIPYNDVFLFDTRNIAEQLTGNRQDVFDMMADILFEDFGSSDFARRKRSVAVNQQQHKLRRYFPELPSWLKDGIFYSRGYSSIGQTTLVTTGALKVEEALAVNNADMVRAFFGMAVGGARNVPSSEERDRFLSDYLSLRPKSFADAYDASTDFKGDPIFDFELVDQICLRENRTSIPGAFAEQIERDFALLMTNSPNHKEWPERIRAAVDLRLSDVLGKTGDKNAYGVQGAEIAQSRQLLERRLLSRTSEDGLRAVLYQLLDDHKRGGLEYTIGLVEQIKRRIDDPSQGIVAVLQRAEAVYAARADALTRDRLQGSVDRVGQAASSSIFSGGGRGAAERYLGQAREDLKAATLARLRSIACREAISLVRSISSFLGDQIGIDERGETTWSGLIGEFQGGRKTVRKMLDYIEQDVSSVRDALKRGDSGAYFVIPQERDVTDQGDVSQEQRLAWAQEAFEGFGGSRELFGQIEADEGRVEMLNKLRAVSKRRLGHIEERAATATDALRALPPGDQRRMLEQMVIRAMPWIYADFGGGFRPESAQYKMIIAVDGVRRFVQEFDAVIKNVLPSRYGLTTVAYEESGVPGRIVCYCELSGLPLDAIAPLRSDWRQSYELERTRKDRQPLHNHRDDLRFPDPVVPSGLELENLRNDLSLFLRGVAFGALRRSAGGPYEVEVGRNYWLQIGDERFIRRRRIEPTYRTTLERAVAHQEERLSALQLFACATYFKWIADRVYTTRKFSQSEFGAVTRAGGVGNSVANELAAEFMRRAERSSPPLDLPVSAEDADDALTAAMDVWTFELKGSMADVDDSEVGRDPSDPPAFRAGDKRALRMASLTDEALMALIAPQAAPAPQRSNAPGAPVAPPAPTEGRYWLFDQNGAVVGPFALDSFKALAALGSLKADTKVCPEGSQSWVNVSDVPPLAQLVAPARPGGPPPPPVV